MSKHYLDIKLTKAASQLEEKFDYGVLGAIATDSYFNDHQDKAIARGLGGVGGELGSKINMFNIGDFVDPIAIKSGFYDDTNYAPSLHIYGKTEDSGMKHVAEIVEYETGKVFIEFDNGPNTMYHDDICSALGIE